MDNFQNDQYRKGYIAGYRDGIRAADSDKTMEIQENDITTLPIKAMGLSSRACNCLSRAGCSYVIDVVSLSDYAIATMRNLGAKTAAEIALWLDMHEIRNTAWSNYL